MLNVATLSGFGCVYVLQKFSTAMFDLNRSAVGAKVEPSARSTSLWPNRYWVALGLWPVLLEATLTIVSRPKLPSFSFVHRSKRFRLKMGCAWSPKLPFCTHSWCWVAGVEPPSHEVRMYRAWRCVTLELPSWLSAEFRVWLVAFWVPREI